MVQVRLLRPITHDWGQRNRGEVVPVTEDVAAEWENRGLAVIVPKAYEVPENKSLVERIRANIQSTVKEVKPEKEPEFPKELGGGWYELSNGKKVRGTETAVDAEGKLQQ